MWGGGEEGGATSHHTHPQLDADVLGCSVESDTQMVRPVDTHNVVDTRRNELDSSGQNQVCERGSLIMTSSVSLPQTDIIEGSGQFMNGRITCTYVPYTQQSAE